MMNRIISILLLISILGSNTPLSELSKFHILIDHFKKHRTEDPNLGLVDFLKMHYFNGDPIDEDYEDDMKLPFKSINTSNIFVFIIQSNILEDVEYDQPIFFDLTTINSKDLILKPHYLDAIWQPPQFI